MEFNHYSLLPLICLILSLGTGIFVLLQEPSSRLYQYFLAICLSIALWFAFYLLYNFNLDTEHIIYLIKIFYCGSVSVATACYIYTVEFLKRKDLKLWIYINMFIVLVYYLLLFKSDLIISGYHSFPWGIYPTAGRWHPFLVIHTLILISLILKMLISEIYKTTPIVNKNHIQYFLVGFSFLTLSAYDFIPNYKINYFPIGYILATIFLMIIGYAVIKHNLMDIHIVFKKSLVYTILITAITLLYLISIYFTEHIIQSMLGYKSLIVSIGSATIIALIFIPLKNIIQDFVEKYLFRGNYVQIIEENELLRQELIRSERLKTVAILASGMAHEIKNPLTPIKTFAEQLPHRLEDKEFLLKFSRIINNEVNRIDTLVQELLDYAKPAPLHLKPTNLHQVLDNTFDFLNNDFIKHKIILNKDYRLPIGQMINLDIKQFRQALLNILLNAIDAMPQEGILNISTTFKKRNTIEIIISDTGNGIASEDLSHIFDPFFSKKDRGTGLGLSITHEIIKNHGGKILVESNPKEGTKFTIQLPL